jgi:bacterioferritin
MEYKVNVPYPEIKVEKKDNDLALKIFNSYAGEVSEDVAIHNYIYQSLVIQDEEIKKILRGIAIVEMQHLDTLGTILKLLGFKPLFLSVKDNKTEWFSGKYINYESNLNNILLDNIKSEESAIKNYENIISCTTDEYVIHILKRIILDERLHIEIFEKLYKELLN